jgi:hypothetical protein
MSQDRYPTKRHGRTQTSIRISKGLKDSVEMFLATDEARLKGFRYYADVTDAAVRSFLERHRFFDVLEETGGEPPE